MGLLSAVAMDIILNDIQCFSPSFTLDVHLCVYYYFTDSVFPPVLLSFSPSLLPQYPCALLFRQHSRATVKTKVKGWKAVSKFAELIHQFHIKIHARQSQATQRQVSNLLADRPDTQVALIVFFLRATNPRNNSQRFIAKSPSLFGVTTAQKGESGVGGRMVTCPPGPCSSSCLHLQAF